MLLPSQSPTAFPVTVLTLFPEMFPGPLGMGIIGRGLAQNLWSLEALNIRSYSHHKHASVDETPFGGGAGMVLRPDVVDGALTDALKRHSQRCEAVGDVTTKAPTLIHLSPRGDRLTHDLTRDLADNSSGMVLLCGRYEAIDERVLEVYKEAAGLIEISIGDYILSGGELAAMVVIESTVRRLPGVVGSAESLAEESFADGLLEYPHYTRPANWQGRDVPEVLLSGHHGDIATWRHHEAEKLTRRSRPDLWETYVKKANQKS